MLSKGFKDPQGRFWGLLVRHEKQQNVMEGSLRSHDWASFRPPGPPARSNGDVFRDDLGWKTDVCFFQTSANAPTKTHVGYAFGLVLGPCPGYLWALWDSKNCGRVRSRATWALTWKGCKIDTNQQKVMEGLFPGPFVFHV
jgi:hypothetical protein